MSILRSALLTHSVHAPRVIGIIGAPGTGKSRVCYEFAEWCRGKHIPVFEARAQPYGAATPLQPILELLRSCYFRISLDESAQEAELTVASRLLDVRAVFETDLSLVCEFLGVPQGERPAARLNPRARHDRLLDILRQMVRHGGTTSSVIIIEDLHWLDEASEAFVTALIETVAETQTLVIVNFRPGYAAPWMQLRHYQQIELTELNTVDIGRLVGELMGSRDELAEARERVVARSGGNPFFAEELVRSLVDNAVLLGRYGDFRRGIKLDAEALPPTVQAVIAERIDRLVSSDRDLLHFGAIIGKEFQVEILRDVADRQSDELEVSLIRLCSAGLLQQSAGRYGRSYAFRHPLIQEVAYATQLRARRTILHNGVARAIERFHHERLDEFASLLSYHFEEAQEVESAVIYAARAARWIGWTNPTQAINHWRKVRMLGAGQPRSPQNDALKITACSQIAWLGWREGMSSDEARPLIQEALVCAREIDDSVVPLLLFLEGRMAVASGQPADAYVQLVRQALSLTRMDRDVGRTATLNACLSQAYGWAGLLREALAANDVALAGSSDISDFDHQFLGYDVGHWALSLRGRILVRLGAFRAARTCFDKMLSIRAGSIDPTVQSIANFGYVELAWCLDDADMAIEHARQVAIMATRQATLYMQVPAIAAAAMAHAIARDYLRGVSELTEGIQFLRRARVAIEFEPELLATLAFYLIKAKSHPKAIEVAREAIAIAHRRHERLPECRASISLGHALLISRGSAAVDEAASLFHKAETLIKITGAIIYKRMLQEACATLANFQTSQQDSDEQAR
jgi:adenylate cyclase